MRSRRLRSGTGWAVTLAGALLLGACSTPAIGGDDETIPQNALDPAPGSFAGPPDDLWNLVFPIAVAVGVLVMAMIAVALVRGRARPDDGSLPKQTAGNTRLEILWTLIPAAILFAVAIPTVQTIFSLAAPLDDPIHVRVVAKQYFWEFEYLDPEQQGVVTATQLAIPTGRNIQLDMQSVSAQLSYNPPPGLTDAELPTGQINQGVIHSFWIPRLAGKADVIPGHTRRMSIRTDAEGLYVGQCGHFCGLSHANMKMSVMAMAPEAFATWIEEQAAPAVPASGDRAAGEELFATQTCIACHYIEGYVAPGQEGPIPPEEGARIGPNLTHFASREEFAGFLERNDDNLGAWLRDPQAEKPGAQMPNLQLTEQEIADLVAYLQGLE